jgi:two-component system, cell cycle sensor histidine kinase and response regulator CckA
VTPEQPSGPPEYLLTGNSTFTNAMTHLRVLLVDDNPHDRQLATRALRHILPDLQVIEVTALAALEAALEQGGFDFAITDYRLLWTDGITVLQAIKARFPDCPVVMYSDSADAEEAVAAMQAGLDDYVPKSARHRSRLPNVVLAVLERTRAYRNARDAHARAEAALKRSHERFTLAAAAVGAVIYDWDLARDTIERTDSLADLVGYAPEDVPPNPTWWMEQIHPDDRARAQADIETALARDAQYNLEYRLRHRDGGYRWVWDRALIVRDGVGQAVRVVGSASDNTTKKELEAQLWHAQRMESIGRLAGGVAHDFNNLLTVILGNAELGLGDVTPDQPGHEEFAEIQRAAGRAKGITRQLLAYARREHLTPRRVNLNDLILEWAPLLQRSMSPQIVFHLELAPELPPVHVDPAHIEQVLMNLAINARDAMPSGGELTISTAEVVLDAAFVSTHLGSTAGAHVLLTVRDTGTGMDANVQAHLFEPFFTTKERGQGTGLGLAMCYGIVKQHGGSIWVESAPGAGTTFTIYLPIAPGAAEDHPVELRDPAVISGDETVLVVEDEPAVLSFLVRVLEAHGYTVYTAASGAEAIARLEAPEGQTVRLVITDELMPGLRGSALIARLRRRAPGLPAILISGNLASLDEATIPGVALLSKPFSSAALLAAVRAALDARKPA